MELLNIRLHPFGGTNNRAYQLGSGLNVIEGPNEHGKSTLTAALWHALHTPTNLTPARLSKAMERWYPLPSGDHVRVTLAFEAEGKTWELEKTWGAGSAARLTQSGGSSLADPGKVQEKLGELLRLNEATWSKVLFTGQAKLAATIEALEKSADKLDDVQEHLAGPAAIPGDMPPEKLQKAVADRIEAHYSQWDRDREGPRDGRSVDNPWKQQVGPVLKAWYQQEGLIRAMEAVKRHEAEMEAVNNEIMELQEEMKGDQEFVKEGRALRAKLTQRMALQGTLEKEQTTAEKLKVVAKQWPSTQQLLEGKEKELEVLAKDLKRLKLEQEHAQKHRDAKNLKDGYERVKKTQKAFQEAQAAWKKLPEADAGTIRELEKLLLRIKDLDTEVAAQRLAARIEAKRVVKVTLQRGTGEPKELSMAPGTPWEGEVPGKLMLETDALRVSVKSDLEDVDKLLADREEASLRQAALLKTLGFKNVEEAKLANKEKELARQLMKQQESAYLTALGNKPVNQWEQEAQAIKELPKTRDLDEIQEEERELVRRETRATAEVKTSKGMLREWEKTYTHMDQLLERQVEQAAKLKEAKEKLSKLPAIPEGYDSVQRYLNALDRHEQGLSKLGQRLEAAKLRKATLLGQQPTRSVEELEPEVDRSQREFKRQREHGEALLRIQRTLRRVVAQRVKSDPLKGLHESIQDYFAMLTGQRYSTLSIDGTIPERVITKEYMIDPAYLSQGTRGSLALALRLALAEAYLKEDRGFLVLDDPFVDLDPERRKAAVEAVTRFSQSKQVLFFTCHPQHAEELRRESGVGAQVQE